jgi:DNA-directed RNA polymerase specialized sigma24 family protein
MAYEADRAWANRLCEEITSGNRHGIAELYLRYHPELYGYARSRLYDRDAAEDVLATFWVRLMDGRALCRYDRRASLGTYLTGILELQIRTVNGQFSRERSRRAPEPNEAEAGLLPAQPPTDCGETDEPPPGGRGATPGLPPGEAEIRREARRILREGVRLSVLLLSDEHPRCGEILWMRLAGLQYEEIAEVDLRREQPPGSLVDPEELRKRTNALKKMATRRPKGCEPRFRGIFEGVVAEYGLDPWDVIP